MKSASRRISSLLCTVLVGFLLLAPASARPAASPAVQAGSGGAVLTGQALPPGLIRVPLARQAQNYTCGVAALQSILGYHREDIRQDVLAKKLKADPQEGTHYRQIEKYARKDGYTVADYQEMTLADLEGLLDAGNPVICLIQAWAKSGTNYATDWKDGHYVVAVGYDSANVYFMDPSTLGDFTYIPVDQFLARWHDKDTTSGKKLVHFGICLQKPGPLFDPDEVPPLG